jgi:hypothetical protein
LRMDTQNEIAAHDLKVLSVGHYIQGGITAFYSLLILLYVAFMGVVFAKFGSGRQEQIPAGFGSIMAAIFGALFLVCATYTLCVFLAAGGGVTAQQTPIFFPATCYLSRLCRVSIACWCRMGQCSASSRFSFCRVPRQSSSSRTRPPPSRRRLERQCKLPSTAPTAMLSSYAPGGRTRLPLP